MEVGNYYPLDDKKKPIPDSAHWTLLSTNTNRSFDISFDGDNLALTATVNILVYLKDINLLDRQTGKSAIDKDGNLISFPYDVDTVGARSIDGAASVIVVDRSSTDFDFEKKAQDIENILNAERYKFVIGSCPKGASCGCRIDVSFKVKFYVAGTPNIPSCHGVIDLYPRSTRADSAHWSEVPGSTGTGGKFNPDQSPSNVSAHECGHLFSFPDEYWENGGSVFNRYVTNEHLDFDEGERQKGKSIWQMRSTETLMGYGIVRDKPTTPPYYVGRLLKIMRDETHKDWRVGV